MLGSRSSSALFGLTRQTEESLKKRQYKSCGGRVYRYGTVRVHMIKGLLSRRNDEMKSANPRNSSAMMANKSLNNFQRLSLYKYVIDLA